MQDFEGTLWHRIKKNRIAYLWVSPFFILFLVFQAWPVLFTFFLSFHKWELIGDKLFIGARNFTALLRDDYFWRAFFNNLFYWVAIVPLRTFLVLVVAVVLNSPSVKMKQFFRAAYLLPHLVSAVFIGLLFRVILAEEGGWVNVMLHAVLRIDPIPWLRSVEWSKISVSLMIYWSSFGYFSIVMLGGLQRIPPELYEAAVIDGAGPVRVFAAVTVPLVLPTTLFVVMISTIRTFSIFEGPLMLTNGGPSFSSSPLTLYLFNNAFDYFKLGYASALAVVMFFIVLLFSIVQYSVLGGARTDL
jgi:ABC-type sugar transport system permease subunit